MCEFCDDYTTEEVAEALKIPLYYADGSPRYLSEQERMQDELLTTGKTSIEKNGVRIDLDWTGES